MKRRSVFLYVAPAAVAVLGLLTARSTGVSPSGRPTVMAAIRLLTAEPIVNGRLPGSNGLIQSLSPSEHPLFDNDDCSTGQSGPVWFLEGSSALMAKSARTTTSCGVVTVPSEKGLYFPLLNSEDALEERIAENPATRNIRRYLRLRTENRFEPANARVSVRRRNNLDSKSAGKIQGSIPRIQLHTSGR